MGNSAEHFSLISVIGPLAEVGSGAEKYSRNKHSSFIFRSVSAKYKKFHDIVTRGPESVYSTLWLVR
jgi:hypothetical protein